MYCGGLKNQPLHHPTPPNHNPQPLPPHLSCIFRFRPNDTSTQLRFVQIQVNKGQTRDLNDSTIGESGGIDDLRTFGKSIPFGGDRSINPLKVTSTVDLLLLMIDGFLGKLPLMRKLVNKNLGKVFIRPSPTFFGGREGKCFLCMQKKVCKKKTNSLC